MGDHGVGLPLMRDIYATALAAAQPRAIKLSTTKDIAAPLPPTNWLVPALGFTPGPPILVAGYGFSGKTMAVQSLALSVAAGRMAWGVYSTRSGRVVHLDYEQGSTVTFERYQRLARGAQIDLSALGDRLAVGVLPSIYLDDQDGESAYEAASEGAAMVIIDSFRASSPTVDENSSDCRKVLDRLSRVSERTGAAFLVIHHANKPMGGGSSAMSRYRIRGSGGIFDACDNVMLFDAEEGEPTNVRNVKARRKGITARQFWLQVCDVQVGSDPRGGLVIRHLDGEQMDQTPARPRWAGNVDSKDPTGGASGLKSSAQGRNRTADTGIFNPHGDG